MAHLDFEQRVLLAKQHAKAGHFTEAELAQHLERLWQQAQAAPPAAPAAPPRAPQAQAAPQTPPAALPRLVAPPGRLGELVSHLRESALYPCTEVAVCSALGIVAGIAGRAYATPGRPTGLNIYLVLVGRTGSGKEALHEGPQALVQLARQKVPPLATLVNGHDYASGPALAKAAAEGARCSVTFSSEFGRMLARMANDRDANAQALRTVLTTLYSKSGPHSVVGDLRYSDTAKHVSISGSVALSIVGESTPGTLLGALTQSMAEDGLLSRVHCVAMPERRAEFNYAAEAGEAPVPPELVQWLVDLATQALTLMFRPAWVQCAIDTDAADWLDGYRRTCTESMEATDVELLRSLHNRAHLKALKYASLMAVAENPLRPVVTEPMVHWAINFADLGVRYMVARVAGGDVGQGDKAREQYVAKLIRRWLTDPRLDAAGLADAGIVTRKYLQQRTSDVAAFNKHHSLGATALLDHTLRAMVDAGYLAEADKAKVTEKYGYQGRCYRVVDLPTS